MQQPQSKVGLYCQVNTNGPLCNVSIQNVPLFEMYSASIPTLLAPLPATAPIAHAVRHLSNTLIISTAVS